MNPLSLGIQFPITDPTWIFFLVLMIILFAPILLGRLRIPHIIGMILAGLLIAYINYLLSRKILKAAPEKFALATVARQIIQVGYLAAVYFIGDGLTVSLVWLLVGAAVGMTVPMAFFTKR